MRTGASYRPPPGVYEGDDGGYRPPPPRGPRIPVEATQRGLEELLEAARDRLPIVADETGRAHLYFAIQRLEETLLRVERTRLLRDLATLDGYPGP